MEGCVARETTRNSEVGSEPVGDVTADARNTPWSPPKGLKWVQWVKKSEGGVKRGRDE